MNAARTGARRRILVVGFSVTADKNGYVEVAFGRDAEMLKQAELLRVGLGGFHPAHIAPLLDLILDRNRPDAVIFEIATSSFRQFEAAEARHRLALGAMLNQCHLRAMPCALLDLPRTDVEPGADWAVALHARACTHFGLPYRRVEPAAEMFQDAVHPTPSGRDRMADALLDLIAALVEGPRAVPWPVQVPFRYSCLPIEAFAPNADLRRFERAGLDMQFAEVHPEAPQSLSLPGERGIAGLLAIAGPKSGHLRLTPSNGSARVMQPYDNFCYYERMYPLTFPPAATDGLVIEQLPQVPALELRKGTKDMGPRIGQIGALFVAEPLPPDNGLVL
jgi:hypothetical protein